MLTPILPAPAQHPAGQHKYETRTRSNSVMKPSARLRQSADAPPPPRRQKPLPGPKAKQTAATPSTSATLHPFPPPHVVLHADDATSKVFIAIGRSFMSVDNRAMTVKDLAELCMKFGLVCQNLSAAGQAITTFIRNHLQRCEAQQDQPLLLRHIMSGTTSDDDLVPALYSRVGGAHCTDPEGEDRLTNFRRGTMVWYLSKAAGAPCPFARAGIRLCDYNENGRVGMPINAGREKKRERDRLRKAAQTAGQKRKRLLRSCADATSGTLSESSDEEDQRPPKVMLTLRLKPCLTSTTGGASSDSAASERWIGYPQPEDDTHSDANSDESDSDSMSVDSDSEGSLSSSTSPSQPYSVVPPLVPTLPDLLPLPLSGLPLRQEGNRRSPSVPYSVFSGSPPPDSEEEDDDFHITMTGARRSSVGRLRTPYDDDDSAWEDDFFGDLDADTETQWESPGPRSPSVQVEDEIVVKQEPTDVRGFLDAWEYLENRANNMKVIDVVAQAAAAERQAEQSASDDLALWTWPTQQVGEPEQIKQEDVETNLFFSENGRTLPPESLIVPTDPCESPVEECSLRLAGPSYELQWRDVEILGPDSLKPHDLEDGAWHEYRGTRAGSPERVQSPSPEPSSTSTASALTQSSKLSRRALTPLDVGGHASQGRTASITSPSLIAGLTSLCIQTPVTSASPAGLAAAPSPARNALSSVTPLEIDTLALQAGVPSAASISTIQFEGVAVYQMTLGSSTLLRRIDTDFVNVSIISQYLHVGCPSAPNAVIITAGSPPVCGTWVPLSVAREVARDEPSLKVFLSDDLRLLSRGTLPHANTGVSSLYGCQFKSASDARRLSMSSHRLELPPPEFEASWEDHLATHPPFILATAAIDGHRPTTDEEPLVVDTPLSSTEEEMFRVLYADPEYDPASSTQEVSTKVIETDTARSSTDTADGAHDQPLRRSKRVANAVATRSRTRSSKRGSRTSLS